MRIESYSYSLHYIQTSWHTLCNRVNSFDIVINSWPTDIVKITHRFSKIAFTHLLGKFQMSKSLISSKYGSLSAIIYSEPRLMKFMSDFRDCISFFVALSCYSSIYFDLIDPLFSTEGLFNFNVTKVYLTTLSILLYKRLW